MDSENSEALQPVSSPDGSFAFVDLLQMSRIAAGKGRSRLELVVGQRHLRPLGIAHGGVMASLLDTAIGVAASSLTPADHWAVTVQLNVNFIRPAWEGETLVATGEVLHAGRQTAVGRGEVRTAGGVLVASGSATCMYLPHTDQTRDRIERRDDMDRERASRGRQPPEDRPPSGGSRPPLA
jgi:uncharacterized protein (TIGR00369 family)